MTPEQEERDREERIRLRALEIWREQGCPDGRAREHWEQAEREVGDDAMKQVAISSRSHYPCQTRRRQARKL